jgi:prolycopene isomerase
MGLPPSKLCFSDMAALLFSYVEFKPYHIKGGSQMLSNAMLEVIYENGGEVLFNTEVEKLLVKNNTVYGVRTSTGQEFQSKYVLSNASAISTFVDMMDEPDNAKVIEQYKGSSVGTSFFTIYCGLDCEYHEVGINEETNFISNTTDMEFDYELSKTLDTDKSSFILTCYNVFDNEMVPKGTSQVVLVTMKYAEPWLKVPPHQYNDEKYRCAEAMLKNAEKVFPGLISHIEEMEIATPITHMRYLGHPGGGAYGFDQYVKDSTLFVSPKPPINGLYCAGSWYGSAGYQPTLTSGHSAARAILKEMRNK